MAAKAVAALIVAVMALAFLRLTLGNPLLMPSDQQFARQFRVNQQRIENLRAELCRIWGPNGGTLAETWMYPELPSMEAQRLRALLREIGGGNITLVGKNCTTGIGMWSGTVVDLRLFRIVRQGYVSFDYGPDDELGKAPCDCVEHIVPLDGGWLLRVGSWSWIS